MDEVPKPGPKGKRDAVARRLAGGFTLIDGVIGTTILVIAILGMVASAFSGRHLSRRVEERGVAFATLGRFVERIRADADWAGLYSRLRPLSQESADDKTLASLAVDTTLPTRPAASYYADFNVPTTLGTVTFLVQVPVATTGGAPALRENTVAPRYGLPYDLNGDGVIDGDARDADYRSLPIVARLRWEHPGEATQEVLLTTWLRGDR
jgi:type II secretory pathway pseudopilin PulG